VVKRFREGIDLIDKMSTYSYPQYFISSGTQLRSGFEGDDESVRVPHLILKAQRSRIFCEVRWESMSFCLLESRLGDRLGGDPGDMVAGEVAET
jgi:hypothetical protein